MSADLRVALRIQANAGNSRREINALNRDLRQAGKEGAKSLASESRNARTAVSSIGRAGVVSYRLIRQSMRDSTKAGHDLRSQTIQTTQSIKQLAQAARVASTQTKSHLRSAEQQGVRPLSLSVDRTSTSFRQLARAAANSGRIIKSVSAVARTEFSRIKGLMGSTNGLLAGAGLGIGAAAAIGASSRTERQVIQLGQTADMTPAQRLEFKTEAFRVAKAYGNDPDAIISGGAALLAGGLSPKAAKSSIDAIGQANAVRGADPTVLAGVGMAAKEAYGFDLENPSAMLEILQKMTIAGDAAKAELENLGDIFNKVGANASAAGFKFHQSLGLIESLSNVEPNPENLRTMVGNFLTVFNTGSYQKQVSDVTGTKFFNKDKSRRDPFEVIGQLKRKYEGIPNDEGRAKFWNVAFKSMDRETVSAWRWMLSGDRQTNMLDISDKVASSAPIFKQQLKENTASSSGTAGRMRATLRDATDRMAQPINKAFADFGSYLLDDLNLSGEQMLAGGAALGIGGYYAGRGAKAGAGALLNKFLGGADTLKNIAVGKVLEEATGTTPVFVTNWPGSMGGVGAPDLSSKPNKGKPSGFIAPWLAPAALGFSAVQIGGSTAQQTDQDRLAMVARDKLINEGQRTYQTSYYRNRISLLDQNPNQSSRWASEQARRLTQNETGMTAAGSSVEGANSWVASVAKRAVDSGLATIAASKRLNELLGKPLIIEIRTDSDHIFAEVERRLDIQLRRGQ